MEPEAPALAQSPADPNPALEAEELAPLAPSTREKITRFAVEGTRLLAVATGKITSRTVWWGVWGAVVGLLVFAPLAWLGWLDVPWAQARIAMLVVFGLLYPIAGAGCWGHAGFWRGVGRFALFVGVERGWVLTLLVAVLDRVMGVLRTSTRVGRALDAVEARAADLPLQRWEELLKDASARVIGEHTPENRGLMRWLRGWVIGRIEKYTLRIVRAEIEAGRGGGVSMTRVREVALLQIEGRFQDGVVGLMNEQLLMMTGLFLALAALPPAVIWGLHRWL
jgi:hypothetical protein